jgi:hypothetical protein
LRIARALAAAALTVGLASTLSPAQAAPVAPPVVQVVDAPVDATPVLATTVLTAEVAKGKTKAGKNIRIAGKLTREGANGYQPLAKQRVLVVFPAPDGIGLLGKAKTSKNGTYTVKVKAKKWMVGQELEVYLVFEGNADSAEAVSGPIVLKVKKK